MFKDYDIKSQPLEGGEYRSVSDIYKFQLERGKIKTVKEVNNVALSVETYQGIDQKNKVTTLLGPTIESKYSYAIELDLESRDYAKAIATHNYSAAAGMDVISSMQDKYQSIQKGIEDTYSGDEKESRLIELDEGYKFLMDSNVVQPTDAILKNEIAINKLKLAFANAYENAKNTKSSESVQTTYGTMFDWKKASEEVASQLENYKTKFEQFKVAVIDTADKEDDAEYANSLLKTINAGLNEVKEKHVATGEKINSSTNDREKELWGLIETKASSFVTDNTYASDEEKYQAFLKNSSQANGVDKRLNVLLNDFIQKDDNGIL
ncbi:hypothetical protein [Anaerosporobacter sp.]